MQKNRLFDQIICISMSDEKKRAMWRKIIQWFGSEYKLKFVNGVKISPEDNPSIDRTYRHPTQGRPMTLGEIGCAMAHVNAWKEVFNDGRSTLILEDDVVSEVKPGMIIDKLSTDGMVGRKWDLLYLGRQALFPDFEEELNSSWIIPNTSWCAHAYILRPTGAHKLLDPEYTNSLFVVDDYIPCRYGQGFDQFQKKWNEKEKLIAYALKKDIFYQEDQGELRKIRSATENSPIYIPKGKDATNRNYGLATVATDINNEGYKFLDERTEFFGWKYSCNLARSDTWDGGNMEDGPGGARKILDLYYSLLNVYKNDDDILIFVDGYDVAPLSNPQEMIQKWLDHFDEDKILFAAEKYLWPNDIPEGDYRKREGRHYPFLNSGCFIGKVGVIRNAITNLRIEKRIEPNDDDQRLWHFLDTKFPDLIEIDTSAEIFQTFDPNNIRIIDENGKIFNEKTKTFPCFIHFNGGQSAKQSYDEFIDYIQTVSDPLWVGKKDFTIYSEYKKVEINQ